MSSIKRAVGHTAIKVKDLDRSVKFYNETVGLPIIRQVQLPEGDRIVFLPGFELWQIKEGESNIKPQDAKFLFHIGLEVKDIESVVKDLESRGVKFSIPLSDLKFEDKGIGVKYALFSDPDGIEVELAQWYKL